MRQNLTSGTGQFAPALSAATARPRQRVAGIAMMLGSSASNQTGAALGALAFPMIGPVGVVAVLWFLAHPPTPMALLLAAACGLLASVTPYVADLAALRRVPASMFSTFTSINPVWAALAGWAILHQRLAVNQWIGIGLIVASNLVVSARGFRTRALARGDADPGTYVQSPSRRDGCVTDA